MPVRSVIAVGLGWWSWWTWKARAAADDEPDAPSAREIVAETVDELLNAVQGLLKDESDRAASLNSRAAGLTGFIGIILSVAAAAGAVVGQDRGAGLDHWVRILVGVLVALALAALVAAVIAVVAKVLLPTEGVTISMSEVKKYPTWEFITRPHVMVQGHLMNGYVQALETDRRRNASKAKWLGRGYKLVCAGLVFVALAGGAATLNRYVDDREPERGSGRGQDERGTGTRAHGNPFHGSGYRDDR